MAQHHTRTWWLTVILLLGSKDAALVYYRKALAAAQHEPEKRMLVLARSHMGDALGSLDQPRYAEALTYFEQALPVAEQAGARGPLSDVLTSIGQMHLERGHYQRAVNYLRRCGNDLACCYQAWVALKVKAQ